VCVCASVRLCLWLSLCLSASVCLLSSSPPLLPTDSKTVAIAANEDFQEAKKCARPNGVLVLDISDGSAASSSPSSDSDSGGERKKKWQEKRQARLAAKAAGNNDETATRSRKTEQELAEQKAARAAKIQQWLVLRDLLISRRTQLDSINQLIKAGRQAGKPALDIEALQAEKKASMLRVQQVKDLIRAARDKDSGDQAATSEPTDATTTTTNTTTTTATSTGPLTDGTVVTLQSAVSGKLLQIQGDGAKIDAQGGSDSGKAAQFKVTVGKDGKVQLRSVASPQRVLRITPKQTVDAQGHGGPWCWFQPVNVNGTHVALRSERVAVTSTGDRAFLGVDASSGAVAPVVVSEVAGTIPPSALFIVEIVPAPVEMTINSNALAAAEQRTKRPNVMRAFGCKFARMPMRHARADGGAEEQPRSPFAAERGRGRAGLRPGLFHGHFARMPMRHARADGGAEQQPHFPFAAGRAGFRPGMSHGRCQPWRQAAAGPDPQAMVVQRAQGRLLRQVPLCWAAGPHCQK
jgi:hypothetical protein